MQILNNIIEEHPIDYWFIFLQPSWRKSLYGYEPHFMIIGSEITDIKAEQKKLMS